MFGNPCFWPQNTEKQGFLTQKQDIISKLEFQFWVRKDRIFLNFENRTILKLAKTKSLENSVFRRALLYIALWMNFDKFTPFVLILFYGNKVH